ncbi:MAG: acyl-CoA dehydrogenase family protein, partial [Acidimicrobiales bacterium]|nr:acyl-CoA dehydrogenase family protein [Acidimicrobiales bacterium]
MDFDLPDELAELQLTVRRLTRDKVVPRAREIDETGEYPEDLFAVFRDAGLLGLCIPEEYEGAGAGILGLVLAVEEVAKVSNAASLMLLLTRLPTGPIMIAGSEDQKWRYLPGIANGSARAAFGLSEPQAGSDVMGMRTKASPDPDRPGGWVLSGAKCWMSGLVQADWYTVFAKTGDPASRAHDSVTAFIVERAWEGVSVGRLDHKLGVRGVDTG